MDMGAAENGAAWEAPKVPSTVGGTFRGYAKKMLHQLLAGGVACGGKPAPCTMGSHSRTVKLRCMDAICRTLAVADLWNTQGGWYSDTSVPSHWTVC
jgi:hypothetical protein